MLLNIYPLFERGRIMKKEMLWAIRDHAYRFGELLFEEYSDGIVTGCGIRVKGEEIEVGTGIMKYGGFLYLVSETQSIPYAHSEEYVSLKVRFTRTEEKADYIKYGAELVLDENLERSENEIEMCRFKLKKGFRLRQDYVSFEDIQTEFDTVNLADATASAAEGPGMSPYITGYFAREAMKCRLRDAWDISFCEHCMRSGLAVRKSFVKKYVMEKLEVEDAEYTNRQIFDYLALILRNIQDGTDIRPARNVRRKREIIVC